MMANIRNETMGQTIKRRRLQLGMSLRDLAAKAGVHHSTIDRIETDYFKVVDPATLEAIADALHIDRLYLLSRNGHGVTDDDIRIIARAANKMNQEERQQMLEILRGTFTRAFENTENDEFDPDGDGYFDERI